MVAAVPPPQLAWHVWDVSLGQRRDLPVRIFHAVQMGLPEASVSAALVLLRLLPPRPRRNLLAPPSVLALHAVGEDLIPRAVAVGESFAIRKKGGLGQAVD